MSDAYLVQLKVEFPRLRVVSKRDDRLSHLIDRLLRVVTFGAQKAYLSAYVTTLGQSIFVPEDWERRSDADRYIVLRHEAVHLRQFRLLSWPLMSLLYVLPILPLGLAAGRAWLEWQGYAETLRATAEIKGMDAARDPTLHEHIVRQFTSGAYGWMWPFPRDVRRWIGRHLQRIERELESG